tara:strand:- start:417 stop:608 length:192 start_codon:yes stop_codon:yes gene_type:complete
LQSANRDKVNLKQTGIKNKEGEEVYRIYPITTIFFTSKHKFFQFDARQSVRNIREETMNYIND